MFNEGAQSKGPISRTVMVCTAVLLVFFSLFGFMKLVSSDPNIPLLSDEGKAKWIRFDIPANLGIYSVEYTKAIFRKSFSVSDTPPNEVALSVRAMKLAEVRLDGRLILPMGDNLDDWKQERVIRLTPPLAPGGHELRIEVVNKLGPPLLLVRSEALGLYTDRGWKSSLDGSNWETSIPAEQNELPELSRMFPATGEALFSQIQILLPLFVGAFLLLLAPYPGHGVVAGVRQALLRPSRVRWAVVVLWAAMAMNNIFKLPLDLGYDAQNHYEYISYIVKNHRIPLASDGWQMFQSPLNYLVSALLYWLLSGFVHSGDMLHMLMRVVPLMCGVLQVEVVYRTLKSVYPGRTDLQNLGIVVAGVLPMNIYISQYVGNEPLAGLLSAVAVMMSLRLLQRDKVAISRRNLFALGSVLGLAMLAKVSPVLLCLPISALLASEMSQRQMNRRQIAVALVIVFGTALLVCGWYYLRNWVEFGKPFIGGWSPRGAPAWWQEPGYRTVSDFLRFGKSLQYPIYSGIGGFWDSVYSTFWLDAYLSSIITTEGCPPWNYGLLVSGALLGVLPCAAMLLGSLRTAFAGRGANSAQRFALACIAVYFAALVWLYLTVPIYTTAKATYTIGIIPCYAIMCVYGLDLFMRNRVVAAFVGAMILCWGVAAYGAYFVR